VAGNILKKLIKISKINNPVYKDLKKLKLIKELKIFYKETRDKKIKVIYDKKTKVIFLEKYLVSKDHYKKINSKNKYYKSFVSNKFFKKNFYSEDDLRRYNQFKKITKNKSILDVGCGNGGYLKLNSNSANLCSGFELRKNCINFINRKYKKIRVYSDYSQIKCKFDVITAFHVLEHLPNQIEFLKNIKKFLKKKGKLILEIPASKDLLFQIDELTKFKKFSLWSEHLILHSSLSLKKFINAAGYSKIKIIKFQRFGLSNHIGWILDQAPGGQKKYDKYIPSEFEQKYKKNLLNKNLYDTLIVVATNEKKS